MNLMVFVLLIAILGFWTPEGGNPDTGNAEGSNSPDSSGDSGSLNTLDDALTTDTEKKPDGDVTRSNVTDQDNKQPDKLFASKFKTAEDLEKAYLEEQSKLTQLAQENANLRKPPEQPPADEWVELSEEQLNRLKENDPEAYSWYLGEKDNRKTQAAVDQRLKPLEDKLKSLDQLTKERNIQVFQMREEKIGMNTQKMFGDEFESLEKARRNPDNISALWPTIPGPIQEAILFHHEKGSPAYSHQLLLQQIQIHNVLTSREKRGRSIPADMGGFGGKSSKDSARDLDEAGDLAAAELGMK